MHCRASSADLLSTTLVRPRLRSAERMVATVACRDRWPIGSPTCDDKQIVAAGTLCLALPLDGGQLVFRSVDVNADPLPRTHIPRYHDTEFHGRRCSKYRHDVLKILHKQSKSWYRGALTSNTHIAVGVSPLEVSARIPPTCTPHIKSGLCSSSIELIAPAVP